MPRSNRDIAGSRLAPSSSIIIPSSHGHLDPRPRRKAKRTQLEQPERQSRQSSLAILFIRPRVPQCICKSAHRPTHSQHRRSNGILQTREQHRNDEWRVILQIVPYITTISTSTFTYPLSSVYPSLLTVCPLRAIEQVHLLLLLRRRSRHLRAVRVGLRVSESRSLPERTHADTVPEAQEAGAGCCCDDPAILSGEGQGDKVGVGHCGGGGDECVVRLDIY